MSDLESVLSGVEPDPSPMPEPEAPPETPEPEVKAEQPEPPAEQPEPSEPETPKNIPYGVFKSTREDLKGQISDLQRQLEANRPVAQPEPVQLPDVIEDQQGYTNHVQGMVQQATIGQKMQMSRFFAEREFGAKAVQEATAFFDDKPQLSQQFVGEPSPFHAAVEYVKAQKAAQEIGSDPEAYKAKLEEEIRAKVQAEMAAQQATEMAGKAPPPSMANVNGSGGQRDPGWQGPTSLNGLIG